MKNILIELDDVNFSYEHTTVLENIDFTSKRRGVLGAYWTKRVG